MRARVSVSVYAAVETGADAKEWACFTAIDDMAIRVSFGGGAKAKMHRLGHRPMRASRTSNL